MRVCSRVAILFLCTCVPVSCLRKEGEKMSVPAENLMIRIAELSIDPVYLEDYLIILKEEAEASMRLEPGVICIFPMFQREDPSEIRIVEIYADTASYEAHLKTQHFLRYKNETLHMVKSLRLLDMEAIDPGTINEIFLKLGD